jgi:murein DD-endopeptidase MepM/ murein hydrolase activator NlpD
MRPHRSLFHQSESLSELRQHSWGNVRPSAPRTLLNRQTVPRRSADQGIKEVRLTVHYRFLGHWIVEGFILLLGLTPFASYGAGPLVPGTPPMPPPVTPACISSPFGPRILPNKRLAGTFHNGIDIPAAVGSSVTSIASGTIIRIHRRGVGGLEVLIQYDGFIGVYSHLGLIAPVVAEGRKAVHPGENIATVGRSGLTYGPHLYFGMIVNGRPVDPAPYLNVAPCGSNAASSLDNRNHPARRFTQP